MESSTISLTKNKPERGGIYEEVGLNTFRNAIGAHYLPHSSEYVASPSIDVVRKWFPTIGYGEEVSTKGTLRKTLLPLSQWHSHKVRQYLLEDIILKLKKKQREKVVPYTRFLSLLIMHKMKEDYGTDEVTLYPTQIFSINNKAVKPNQPEEPPFTDHMLVICALGKPVVFKAPKTSLKAKSVSQGAKPRAKNGHKRHATSFKPPFMSSKEATKGESSKVPTGSKTGHSKRRKESSSAMDSNPSRTLVSTPIDTEMHKEDQQATAEVDPGISTPNDSIPSQQGMDEGTKNTSYDHISVGTDPHVLADQTKSVSEGLKTVLTQPITEKEASTTAIHGDKEKASTANHGDKEEASSTIKLEDLAKLVSKIQPSFKDLDSPEDDPVIIVDESDKDDPNAKTEDTSGPRSSSPSSLPTELKDLPSKFNELTEEIKELKTQVHELEIELPKELKEIPIKLEDFTKTATSLTPQVAKPKTP
uniref:Uncharacterized protein n=1 Tax=Tanacetum cinerariifolium TaxID=118510 RepID=A0A699HXS2_TANCI|nr:hypothetical protein [Tanacetum cinerariifolium]